MGRLFGDLAGEVLAAASYEDEFEGSSNFSRGLSAGYRSAKENLARIPAALGVDAAQEYADRMALEREAIMRGSTAPQSYTEVDDVGSALSYAGNLFATNAAPLATMAAGGLAGLGLKTVAGAGTYLGGATAANVALQTGEALGGQYEQAGEYNLPTALAAGTAGAYVDRVLPTAEGLISRGRAAIPVLGGGGRAGRAATTGIVTAGSESVAEGTQQLFQEAAKLGVDSSYDILNPDAQQRYKEALVGGAVMGGTIGTVAGAASRGPVEPGKPVPESEDVAPASEAAPLSGETQDLFGAPPRVGEEPEAAAALEEKTIPAERDLFADTPSATARSDYDPKQLRERLRQANSVQYGDNEVEVLPDWDITPSKEKSKNKQPRYFIDAFMESLAQENEKTRGTFLRSIEKKLDQLNVPELSPAKEKKLTGRFRQLREAQKIVAELDQRQGDAKLDEATRSGDRLSSSAVYNRLTEAYGTQKAPDEVYDLARTINKYMPTMKGDTRFFRSAVEAIDQLEQQIAARKSVIYRDAEQELESGNDKKAEKWNREIARLDALGRATAEARRITDEVRSTFAGPARPGTLEPVDIDAAAVAALDRAKPGVNITLPPPGYGTVEQIRERNLTGGADTQLQLDDISQREQGKQAEAIQAARRAVLQDIVDDPETRNPNARFIAALRKTFGKDALPTPEEYKMLREFNSAKAAFSGEDPLIIKGPPPDTQDTTLGVPEAAPPPATAAPKNVNKAPKPPVEEVQEEMFREGQMRPVGKTKGARFEKEMEARREIFPPETVEEETTSPRQGELFTAKTGQPTKQAMGVSKQQTAQRQAERLIKFITDNPDNFDASAAYTQVSAAVAKGNADPKVLDDIDALVKAGKTDEAVKLAEPYAPAPKTPEPKAEPAPTPKAAKPKPEPVKAAPKKAEPQAPAPKAEPKKYPASNLLRAKQLQSRVNKTQDKGKLTPRDAGKAMRLLDDPTPENLKSVDEMLTQANTPETKLSPARTPGTGLSKARVEEKIKPVLAGWKKAPPVMVVDLNDPANTPELNEKLDTWGAKDAYGFYVEIDGQKGVVLISNNLSEDQVLPTLYHESLGHFGLVKKFGKDLDALLESIYRSTPDIRAKADAYREANPYLNDRKNPTARAVEEILVQQLEQGPLADSVFKRLKDFIMQFARRMGLYRGKFSNDEIAGVLRAAQRSVMGEGKPAETRDDSASEVRFSKPQPAAAVARPKDLETKIEAKIDKLPLSPEMKQTALEKTLTLYDMSRIGIDGMTFGRDLQTRYEDVLKSSKEFFDLTSKQQALIVREEQKIATILDKAASLSNADRDTTNKLLNSMTRQQKWGFKPDWKKDAQVDSAMAAEFDAAPKSVQQIVTDIFRSGHEQREMLRQVVKEVINSDIEEALAKKPNANKSQLERERLNRMKRFDKMVPSLNGPYAPLRRFGNYVAVGKSQTFIDLENKPEKTKEEKDLLEKMRTDADHYAVFFEDTYGKAVIKAKEIEKDLKLKSEAFAKEKFYQDVQEMPWAAFQRVRVAIESALEASGNKKNKASLEVIDKLLRDLYLNSLAEASARKHDMRRENIEGANDDMLRAFAVKGKTDAYFTAALMQTGKLTKAINAMREEATNAPDGTRRSDARRALNELLSRHVAGMDVQETPLTDKLLSVTSTWLLLTAPRYFILNGTQTYVVTLPVLGGRFGMGASGSAVTKAYADLNKSIGNKWDYFTKGDFNVEDIKNLPDDEIALLKRLREAALLDIGLNYELGQWDTSATNPVSQAFANVQHKLRTIARQIEVANRVSAGLAAYRLAKATPGKIKDLKVYGEAMTAEQYAESIIAQTHFDYTAANAPRYFNQLWKPITQFRKYQLGVASLLIRLTNDSFRNASAEERAIARKSLTFLLTETAALTGAMGLPFIFPIAYVLSAAFGDDDEPFDTERTLREFMPDELATLLTRGIPAAAGVDISQNLGMANIFNPLPYNDGDIQSREGYQKLVVGAMGPLFGLGANMADGVGYFMDGNWVRGTEMMMPSLFKSGIRTVRNLNEGVTKENGDVLLSSDEIDFIEGTLQVLGFTPSQIQDLRRKQTDLRDYEEFYTQRTKRLKYAYTQAAKDKDATTMRALRDDWQALQESRKRNGFKVQPISDLVKAPAEQRKRERKTIGGIQYDSGNKRFVEELSE